VVILAIFAFMAKAEAGTIVLEGKYQQKNIFVINSIAPEGVGFLCLRSARKWRNNI